jgi:hypothetical protein
MVKKFFQATFMTSVTIAAITLAFLAATSAYAGAMTEEQVQNVEAAVRAIGCTVEEIDISTRGPDISAKGDRYEANDVECKDGNYDMILDKDFKIVNRKKED